MRSPRKFHAFSLLAVLVFVVGCCGAAGAAEPVGDDTTADACDWKRGDLHKMHWPQLPDMSPKGIDVSLAGIILADDFKCTATGPIRDIHLWGSFYKDVLPENGPDSLTFELRIYSDIPADADRWSRPGELLWKRKFEPGQYTALMVHDGPEGWYDLVTNEFIANNHRLAFQYNFCIDEEPFVQKEGEVYWLAVRELPVSDGYVFGWKTTPPRLHFNDDAVYFDLDDLNWLELTYPREHKYAGETLDLAFVITSGDETLPENDLGDAPDGSNSFPGTKMLAYPSGVVGSFPTVYQAGSPPYGPRHLQHAWSEGVWLGPWVSRENEADLGPDEDVVNNLFPPAELSDRDGNDDGLHLPVAMPHCQESKLTYTVTVSPGMLSTTSMYVNVWCDWNRDGDWNDTVVCPDGVQVPEWAVQNQLLLITPGIHVFDTPSFRCWHSTSGDDLDPMWLRMTLAEKPWEAVAGTAAVGGAGPEGGYRYGETEDYYLRPGIELQPERYDWADAPDDAAAPGYPTLKDNNGARHLIAGPWLGDKSDKPDPEDDGQPDLGALGDDNNGSNDENGASVPPLIVGEPAYATVQVAGGGGILQAWIDFDNDRVWQDDEQIFNGFLPNGIHVLPFAVPGDAVPGSRFARFRISRRGGLEPYGPAMDGEVEDHAVLVYRPPANAKWCQWPDLTPHGIDIRVDSNDTHVRVVADDFECTSTERLTHVRLWGSWKRDARSEIKRIRLRIHRDDPVGPQGADKENKYSKPGPETLWRQDVYPGQFEEKLYHVVAIGGEWWWDPNTGESHSPGDTQVWQIDIDIDPDDAFLQEGTLDEPRIYWLAVDVETAEGEFGWKTRQWPQHFMDDAVWDVENMVPRIWRELRYPEGHRYHEHEKNSIDMAFCLMFSGEGPGPVTCQPICMTQCPPVETTCPALVTECPAAITRCPPVNTKCPALKTRCPVVQTECPPALTECPPAITQCQIAETQCPSVPTKCPPIPTRCPVEETKCPPLQTKCPVVETECPPVETECPPFLTQCQGTVTRCPPITTRCPAVETECPVAETKCPAVETQCPASATQCPPVDTRCPPVPTHCPVAETQCPAAETKCPVVETQCPASATQCPPVPTHCPVAETRCPAAETKCPVVETQCPASATQCPPVNTRCPPASTHCPVAETRCPATETKCPPEQTMCPPVDTECPVMRTVCPPTQTLCQQSETQCPPIVTRCPPVSTRCPPLDTQCSAVDTQCPVMQTRCPPVDTECPPVATQCPLMATACRPLYTVCPPVQTECPALRTECPVINTQCSICIFSPAAGDGRDGSFAAVCPAVETPCLTVSQYLVMAKAQK